jgi:(2R)-sulfolactate sulfo-lyase subunit alpha
MLIKNEPPRVVLMMKKFWVHAKKDYVGVAVDDITKNEETIGVFMDDGKEISLTSREEIPLGHKIALRDVEREKEIIEYNEVIGVSTKNIRKGEHVHVHNLKSLRWKRP